MKLGLALIGLVCTLVVSQTPEFAFEFDCHGFQNYILQDDGRSFEIDSSIGLSVAKRGLYMLDTFEVGKRPRCANIAIGEEKITFADELVFPYHGDDGNRIDIVVPLSETPTSANEPETISAMIERLRSPGYIGSVWIDRENSKEILLNEPLTIVADSFNSRTLSCPNETISEDDRRRFNCVFDDTFIDDYFLNNFSYNWGLWVLIFYLLGFFFISTCADDVIPIEYVDESDWTLHPAVSIYTRGSDIYSKQSRLAQYFFFMGSLSFFTALMHINWDDEHLAIRLIVFPIFGGFFGLITTLISGMFLNLKYKAIWDYINGYKATESIEQRKENLDRYEKRDFQISYIYYVGLLLIMANFTIWPIYILQGKHVSTQGYWVVGIVIGVVFDLLLWRVVMVFLARASPFLKKLYKGYGFYYDSKMHDEYSAIVGYKVY